MAKPAQARSADVRLRVGVVAGDPLRGLGFQALFQDHIVIAIVPVGETDSADSLEKLDLDLIVVAAQNASQIFEAIQQIHAVRPLMRLIVMATREEPEFVERVLRVGAHGFLTATAARGEIEEAIAQVYDGQMWRPLHTAVHTASVDIMASATVSGSSIGIFTDRELQVLDLLHSGQSNREIADELRIEERTVKSHVARLLKKMGVKNRTALIMQAIGQNLVEYPGRQLVSSFSNVACQPKVRESDEVIQTWEKWG